MRRHRDSLAVFNREIASRPNHAPAYYNKGSLLFDLGRFEEALVSFRKS
ncbi:tetratricopeptide repeat protein [candidate division KSB1 bacterium]|nr:tetratricopeptide repeat protein [candidate division KSB1 bacterium]